jgi:hypothetical protein
VFNVILEDMDALSQGRTLLGSLKRLKT